MKISDEQFRNGQASFQRGVGLRNIFEQVNTLNDEAETLRVEATDDKGMFLAATKEAEGISLALGYLDGVAASIRRIDNLLLMPAGPDK